MGYEYLHCHRPLFANIKRWRPLPTPILADWYLFPFAVSCKGWPLVVIMRGQPWPRPVRGALLGPQEKGYVHELRKQTNNCPHQKYGSSSTRKHLGGISSDTLWKLATCVARCLWRSMSYIILVLGCYGKEIREKKEFNYTPGECFSLDSHWNNIMKQNIIH